MEVRFTGLHELLSPPACRSNPARISRAHSGRPSADRRSMLMERPSIHSRHGNPSDGWDMRVPLRVAGLWASRRQRSTDQPYELPPVHSITSSARARSVGPRGNQGHASLDGRPLTSGD